MTEAAQEDLTGMPTPKQDERTPGRLAESLAQMIIEWVDGSKGGDWKTGLPNIIQRRIDRLDGNAYGSTDALRSALAEGRLAAVALSALMRVDGHHKQEIKWCRVVDKIDAALSGSPAPSTEGLREALRKIDEATSTGGDGDFIDLLDFISTTARTALAGVTAPKTEAVTK